jgi:hypothetical protein
MAEFDKKSPGVDVPADKLADYLASVIQRAPDAIQVVNLRKGDAVVGGFMLSVVKEHEQALIQIENAHPIEVAQAIEGVAERIGQVLPGGIYRFPTRLK